MEDADWRDLVDNNLNVTANNVRAFAPKVVSASKRGILGLMKSAAMKFGQYNVTVDALIPGLVDMPLTRCEKRLSERVAKAGQNLIAIDPTTSLGGEGPRYRSRSARSNWMIFRRQPYFWHLTLPTQ